jgi:hypothetical protein
MDNRNRMIFAIISGLIIFIISIIIAFISFSILESSAEATLKSWKLGGAFAAFVFTASLLTSIIFQFYKQLTSDKIKACQQQIQDLQNKLIRGATCPKDYVIDLDDKHKIVFSRPNDWSPKGGILYQYIKINPSNIFPTNFNVIYHHKKEFTQLFEHLDFGNFDGTQNDIEKLYNTYFTSEVASLKAILQAEDLELTKEYIFIDNIKSMKLTVTSTFVPSNFDEKKRMCQTGVVTYVSKLNALFSFTFSDSKESYTKSSEVFNNVITSIRFL